MTKKHFIRLADALRLTRPYDEDVYHKFQWTQDRNAIADFCEAQNSRFNRERWFAYIEGACGPNGGKIK